MSAVINLLSQGQALLVCLVLLPAVFSALIFFFGKKDIVRLALTLAGAAVNLVFAVPLFFGKAEIDSSLSFGGFGLDLVFRVFDYSALFLFLASAAFAVITLYCSVWLNGKAYADKLMAALFVSLAMVNGAFLADDFGSVLFFWEGLLCTLFGILLINNRKNYSTAVKALTLSGFADLLLMLGIIITCHVAGTSRLSEISGLAVEGEGIIGFVCLMLGSLGKAGCMPFHSWIPCAAKDAPLPFMAFFPGALEKLVGFYLAVRVMSGIYHVESGDPASVAVMALGALTLVFAVAMALIQKDMKKLLSYHAVSQVGYMVLGIGSALPVGYAGGLFHMLNNVVYKSALFMVAGIIEKKLGTTDLRSFSGLGKKMPVTAVCFTLCGLSIAGVPPFNGFFSKELIFDAALESETPLHYVFYACALVGAFMTAVSFLKMGRAAFSGKLVLPDGVKDVDEKGIGMKIPACVMAVLCVVFGLFNKLPVDNWFRAATRTEESFGGWPHSPVLVIISLAVLTLALLDHIYGCKKTGKPINAADHIHYAPGLHQVYGLAEKGVFDPYNWLNGVLNGFSFVCVKIEQGVSFVYDKAIPGAVRGVGNLLHKADNGSLSRYVGGIALGFAVIAAIFAVIFIIY